MMEIWKGFVYQLLCIPEELQEMLLAVPDTADLVHSVSHNVLSQIEEAAHEEHLQGGIIERQSQLHLINVGGGTVDIVGKACPTRHTFLSLVEVNTYSKGTKLRDMPIGQGNIFAHHPLESHLLPFQRHGFCLGQKKKKI